MIGAAMAHTDSHGHSLAHIWLSLFANLGIAIAKGVAAFFTGSGAMLAETIHSVADCGNQILLLVGVRGAQKLPTESHPLGYGRNAFFWSFMVALLLFSLGGMFSIYEGVHKVLEPESVERVWLGVGILAFSLVLEAASLFGAVREMRKRGRQKPLMRYVRETTDSDLVVVFGENLAAVLGLGLALGALVLSHVTGDPRWDAAGSIGIGLVLIVVAVFLAVEVKSLLLGERAEPELEVAVREIVAAEPSMHAVWRIITVQQGPGEVLLAMKVEFDPTLSSRNIPEVINRFEQTLRSRRPDAKWIFVEPDTRARAAQAASGR
jgi:cation diffusion facilitator family transporter